MDRPHVVTGALDDETLALLDRLAEHFGCTREHLVATAVMRFVAEESRIFPGEFDHLPPCVSDDPRMIALDAAEAAVADAWRALAEEGEDAIERGDFVAHEDLMAELRGLDDRARRARNAA